MLDLHWLAGLLEGEGSFLRGFPSQPNLPCIQCVMIDRDVIERLAGIIGCGIRIVKPRRAHWQESYGIRVRGAPAVAWMQAIEPLLGARRRGQIEVAIGSYESRSNQRLDDADARTALHMLVDGVPVRDVADRFGVTPWCIYDLRLGRTHKHLARPVSQRPAAVG